ncbi:hypothetical protein [Deinococcus sp. KSM4-11]|uniref:hypothetical protein n=1 Tax=Deinococcus sp. KSM4-11 TaxID=2568654 RepID=UPI001454CB39|nr:hypothetical protein [Deinococcus sp. KSM4-11]
MNGTNSGAQLIRQGAYTAVGSLLVYGVIALSLQLYKARQQAQTTSGCGCGCGGTA